MTNPTVDRPGCSSQPQVQAAVEEQHGRQRILISVAIALLTFSVYVQVRQHEFLNWDDDIYVTDNPHIRTGLSWANVAWAFTSVHGASWHPLTSLSHMLDCELFGLNAGAHALVNAALHTCNAVVLFLLFAHLTSAIWCSAVVAALFALHPLHVESVAWISERKDVLSTLLFLLTLAAYAWYAQQRSWQRYLVVVITYGAGMMAKPMLVTLPLVLLLLDWWPLGRLKMRSGSRVSAPRSMLERRGTVAGVTSATARIIEKLPLAVLAIAVSIVTVLAQRSTGAVVSVTDVSLGPRLINALVSYWRYLDKALWPADLAAFYPYEVWPGWYGWTAGAALMVTTVAAGGAARRWPYLAVGWLWYVITLLPVIGLVQVGSQAMADRYTYVPLIGIFIAVAWGVADLPGPLARYVGVGLALLSIVACTIATWWQVQYWRNSVTLFTHALATAESDVAHNHLGHALVAEQPSPAAPIAGGALSPAEEHYVAALRLNPRSAEAQNNVANILTRQGQFDAAIERYREALRLNPRFAEAHNNLGFALSRDGDLDGAAAAFESALQLKPDYTEAHFNLAEVYARRGQTAAAAAHYGEAVRLRPDSRDARLQLGITLAALNRVDEAIEQYRAAIRIAPADPMAHYNLGNGLARQGQVDAATAAYGEAIRLRPDWVGARVNLGIALASVGRLDAARAELEEAIRLQPDFARAHSSLALALVELGQEEEAIEALRRAMRLDPARATFRSDLAWILATSARPQPVDEAVALAEEAAARTGGAEVNALDSLAAAYARASRYQDAVAAAQRALQLAQQSGQQQLVRDIGARLELYRAGKPFTRPLRATATK